MAKRSKYRLGERIGGGGMAEVYRATLVGAEGFARQVAIKRMLPTLSADSTFAEMFVNEARLASLLGHPNIVSTLDFDRDEEERLFLVMELIDGCDLRQLLATGRPPVGVSAFIIAEVLRALGYAHDLQQDGRPLTIVHRDVSPHNVLLSWAGAVKLSDFGIAKAIAASSASRTGSLKGKVAYMSPEQAHGLPLDGRSDLFAVGVMFHELLTGARLFGGATEAEVLSRMLAQPISSPRERFPDISEDVDFVCMRLLARDRDQRFASAQAALEALLGSNAVSVRAELELKQLLRERFPAAAPVGTGSLAPRPASESGPATQPQSAQAVERARLMDAETRTRMPSAEDAASATASPGTASATPTAVGERIPPALAGTLPDRSDGTATRARARRAGLLGLVASVPVFAAIVYFAFFTGGGTGPADSAGPTGHSDPLAVATDRAAAPGPPVSPTAVAAPANADTSSNADTPGSGVSDTTSAAADGGADSLEVSDPDEPLADPAAEAAPETATEAPRADTARRRRPRRSRRRADESNERRAPERSDSAGASASEERSEASRDEDSRAESKKPGRLRVTVRPWALVSIDGGEERQTPLPTVTLAPGRHRIRLRNDELDKNEVRTITVRSGKTRVIDLDWRR